LLRRHWSICQERSLQVLPFFKVIEESGILPHYTLSREPGVGFAADAAGRYHCSLGVGVVTSLETPCRIFLKEFF
jgi:hypothetical protein